MRVFFAGLLATWLLGDSAVWLLSPGWDWTWALPAIAGPVTTVVAGWRVKSGRTAPGWAMVSSYLLGWLVIFTIEAVIRFPGAVWYWSPTAALLPAAVAMVVISRRQLRLYHAEIVAPEREFESVRPL